LVAAQPGRADPAKEDHQPAPSLPPRLGKDLAVPRRYKLAEWQDFYGFVS
jgi:hypothetical protein